MGTHAHNTPTHTHTHTHAHTHTYTHALGCLQPPMHEKRQRRIHPVGGVLGVFWIEESEEENTASGSRGFVRSSSAAREKRTGGPPRLGWCCRLGKARHVLSVGDYSCDSPLGAFPSK